MIPLNRYILESEQLKKLGSGEEGTCYLMKSGNIKKVFHRNTVPVTWQLLFQASKFVDLQCLTKVIGMGDDYIIREPIKPKTSLCKKYYKIATTYDMGSEKMFRWVMRTGYYDPDTDQVISNYKGIIRDEEAKEVFTWLYKLKYELSQIAGPTAGLGDFGLQNLGETEDGRVVMFDF